MTRQRRFNANTGSFLIAHLADHQDIRILGAKRTIDPDEEEALIASVTSVSEVLHVIA